VVVSPDLPVGAVIATKLDNAAGYGLTTCTGTTVFNAKIVASGSDLGNKVYSTAIPGIGLRFSRGGQRSILSILIVTTGGFLFSSKVQHLRWI
jgi:hypothetical protein